VPSSFICTYCLLILFVGKKPSRPAKKTEPEKDITEPSTVPPPVGDAESWPTPDTANHEERKKSQSQDKGDSKSPGLKPNQKWVPVPYVPTAKFNTPLPPTVSRRGGRPARGSRESGTRGGPTSQASISDKAEKARPMGPPPLPKQNLEQQRGRDQEALAGSRAASAPTHGRRATSVGPAFADQRRSTHASLSDHGPFESKKHDSSEPQNIAVDSLSGSNEENATPTKSRADSRSFSRQSSSSYRTGTHDSIRHVSGETHAHPRSYAGTERRNTYAEIDRQSEASGRRERRDSNKEIPKTRDFEFRTDSWRDREFVGERPEQRNGRGRGGYRGRGTHPPYAAAQSNHNHAFTAPLPQQPFSGGKPHALGERHRQSSAPYGGMPPQTSHRNSSRSQSIATNGVYPAVPNNFGQPLSPIQSDLHGVFGGYPTMYPGIMSAMPYNAALEPMALISMVAAQLEYYFSIENLCKDMYLRSHMDSQGWVPLSVIAGFNRIKTLTEDVSLIRHVCQMSRSLEFRPGDDGTDRLRKLEKWDQWILDMDQRQPHAQNDGPPPLQQSQSPPHLNSVFHPMSHMTNPTWAPGPFYNGYAEASSFVAAPVPSENQDLATSTPSNLPEIPSGDSFSLTNGQSEPSPGQFIDVPGHSSPATKGQDMSPNGPSMVIAGTATTNGHTPASPKEIGVENVFSNERMNELHVCVRHPTYQYPPSFISPVTRTFSDGSIDGQLPNSAQLPNPMPSLRGGSGSPNG
jgi:la-related protein 1